MWYFIIGVIVAVGVTVWQAVNSMEEFEEDIRKNEWWLALLYCAVLWPVFIIALVLIMTKRLV